MTDHKTRVDKWLWSVRIFKSRSIASEACRNGSVKISEKKVKPSYLVCEGDIVEVKKNGYNLIFLVKRIISKRVSAPLAVECYENQTSEEEMNKFSDWFMGKAKSEFREKGIGRPTKRQRREIDLFKEDQFNLDAD